MLSNIDLIFYLNKYKKYLLYCGRQSSADHSLAPAQRSPPSPPPPPPSTSDSAAATVSTVENNVIAIVVMSSAMRRRGEDAEAPTFHCRVAGSASGEGAAVQNFKRLKTPTPTVAMTLSSFSTACCCRRPAVGAHPSMTSEACADGIATLVLAVSSTVVIVRYDGRRHPRRPRARRLGIVWTGGGGG